MNLIINNYNSICRQQAIEVNVPELMSQTLLVLMNQFKPLLLFACKFMSKYYINWSPVSGNYLVKRIGDGKILQIFDKKIKAEKFIKQLEEKENGEPTKGKWICSNSN